MYDGTGMVKLDEGLEDRVKEGVWGGINSTKDLSKKSCENLLLSRLPKIDTYTHTKRIEMELP